MSVLIVLVPLVAVALALQFADWALAPEMRR